MKKENISKIKKRIKKGEFNEVDGGYILSLILDTVRKDDTSIFGDEAAEFEKLLDYIKVPLHTEEGRIGYNVGLLKGALMVCNSFCEMRFEEAGLESLQEYAEIIKRLIKEKQITDMQLNDEERNNLIRLNKAGIIHTQKLGTTNIYFLSEKGQNTIKLLGKKEIKRKTNDKNRRKKNTRTTE